MLSPFHLSSPSNRFDLEKDLLYKQNPSLHCVENIHLTEGLFRKGS